MTRPNGTPSTAIITNPIIVVEMQSKWPHQWLNLDFVSLSDQVSILDQTLPRYPLKES